MLPCLQSHSHGTVVCLYVQPRASRNQIVGLHDDCLKVRLTSPPVDGAANKCCRDFLAKLFRMAKSDVELIAGDKSRQKKILLHGRALEDVAQILKAKLVDS